MIERLLGPVFMTLEYASRLDISDMRNIQKELLKGFALFCENRNLRYMLAGGTLLGAIRHHGYIPWDDDIDVMMPRPDYQRLIDLSSELERFVGGCLRYSSGIFDRYHLPFAKLFDPNTTLIEHHYAVTPLGVNIDIFPVDAWPAGQFHRNLRRKYVGILVDYVLPLKNWTRSCPGRFPWFIYAAGQALLKVIPIGLIIRHITQVASREEYTESGFGGIVVGPYREVVKMVDLVPTSTGEFEGYKYAIPGKPDEILSVIYGSYLELPPIEKRISHHHCDIFDIPLNRYLVQRLSPRLNALGRRRRAARR